MYSLLGYLPKRSYLYGEDEEGFEYPQIDENECARCYRCLEVCLFKEK